MKISQKVKSIYFLSIDIILNQEISTLVSLISFKLQNMKKSTHFTE